MLAMKTLRHSHRHQHCCSSLISDLHDCESGACTIAAGTCQAGAPGAAYAPQPLPDVHGVALSMQCGASDGAPHVCRQLWMEALGGLLDCSHLGAVTVRTQMTADETSAVHACRLRAASLMRHRAGAQPQDCTSNTGETYTEQRRPMRAVGGQKARPCAGVLSNVMCIR